MELKCACKVLSFKVFTAWQPDVYNYVLTPFGPTLYFLYYTVIWLCSQNHLNTKCSLYYFKTLSPVKSGGTVTMHISSLIFLLPPHLNVELLKTLHKQSTLKVGRRPLDSLFVSVQCVVFK